MPLLRTWFLLLSLTGVCWSAVAQAPPAPDRDSLTDILADLKDVEAEMSANQGKIEDLRENISRLQVLGKNAEAQIAGLQALVEAHEARVQQLGDRYAKVLELAQRLKKDLEVSVGWNYALGTGAAVAVVVAVLEGLALMGK